MVKKIKCPADILYEKEWRAAYGNRCNAVFLSNVMGDAESMRKLFHRNGNTHQMTPFVKIFWEYYQDRDKEKMLDQVEAVNRKSDEYFYSSQPFEVDEYEGKRVLRDWSTPPFLLDDTDESPWADLNNYEKRETIKIIDYFGSKQSVYYDNKSVAEVLKDTIEKTTFLEKQIEEHWRESKDELLFGI